jgi:mRNA-degrading endonuclease RelE of RelBE toxin-antitoxin system
VASDYDIELTETAEKVYLRAFDDAQECVRRGDSTNSKVKHFRIIQEALDTIIPHDPFNPSRALSGSLSNIFRIKKGRVRICYIGSSKRKKITVLFISDTPRKAGDRKDPYVLFSRVLESGDMDSFFDDLGIPVPSRRQSPASVSLIQRPTIPQTSALHQDQYSVGDTAGGGW